MRRLAPIALVAALALAACAPSVVPQANAPEASVSVAAPSSTALPVSSVAAPVAQPATPDVLLQPKGEVSVQAFGSDAWAPITEQALLDEGDGIKTGAASSATVTFGDGSIARLNANTTLYLAALGTDAAQDVSLRLVSGEVWNKVQTLLPQGGYGVQTESTLAIVRGTEFGVEIDAEGTVDIATYESEVEVATTEPASEGDEPIVSTQGSVVGGQRLRIAKGDIAALAAQRARLRAEGKPRDAVRLGLRPGAIPPERLSRAFLAEGRTLPLKKLQLSPEERARLRARVPGRAGSEIPAIARERISMLVTAGLLRPADVARLVPFVRKDLAGFLRDSRGFLRANGVLVVPSLPSVAPTASVTVSPVPARTAPAPAAGAIDWTRLRAALTAARDRPVDPASQRLVLEIALTAAQRAALGEKGLLTPLQSLKSAASAKDYDRMNDLAGRILSAL